MASTKSRQYASRALRRMSSFVPVQQAVIAHAPRQLATSPAAPVKMNILPASKASGSDPKPPKSLQTYYDVLLTCLVRAWLVPASAAQRAK
mmetsp:Transcript_9089/g.16389  ORF Transcript_9089/g.16389 Transcript_9089/m.16389 type:complete len:91 (+) Transcript_9089:1447-1719(+)